MSASFPQPGARVTEPRPNGYSPSTSSPATDVNRVEAATDVADLAEQRALEKAGFIREGILRGAQFRAGSWHDLVYFSLLRKETLRPGPMTAGMLGALRAGAMMAACRPRSQLLVL